MMWARGVVLGSVLAVVACEGARPDDEAATTAATEGAERRGTFVAGATPDVGVVRAGVQAVAVEGPRVRELTAGRDYLFTLSPTGRISGDGLPVHDVRAYRPIVRVVGTVARDQVDPKGMVLASARGKTWALSGIAAAGLREMLDGMPPEQDYEKTPFVVSLAARASGRADALDAAPVPLVTCDGQVDPTVRVELVSVRPDDGVLDGFLVRRTGGEPVMGPHVACERRGASFACTVDRVGEPWGTLELAGRPAFEAELLETATGARTPLACRTLDRAALASRSED